MLPASYYVPTFIALIVIGGVMINKADIDLDDRLKATQGRRNALDITHRPYRRLTSRLH